MPGPFLSDLTAIGLAKEATFGTALASTMWLLVHDINIEKKPNVILPELFRQNRSPYSEALPGIAAIGGDITAPLFPDAGNSLFCGGIGQDGSVTGSTPTLSTTLSSAVVAGDTTISTTAGGFAPNDIIQVDTTISGVAECHKVLSISGSGPFIITLAAGEALLRGHASGVAVAKVVAPFTHNPIPANTLPSFTIEKNANGMDIQYAGNIVSKLDLKLGVAADAQVVYSMLGQRDAVLGSPATPVWPTDVAFGPSAVNVSIGGASDLTTSVVDLTVDNGGKPEPTFNGQTYPQFVVPTTRKIVCKATVFLQALAGGAPSAGYYADLVGAPSRAIVLTFTAGTNIITLTLPAAVLTAFTEPIKRGELVMQTLEYTALIGGANNQDIFGTIQNGNYLSY